MKAFKDLESLEQFLKQDAKRVSLNPVRFINVDSLYMWNEVKKLLLSLADETVFLSKFCEGNDTTPNINRLNAYIKKTANSQLITPLSEYLRIVPDRAETIIQKFIKGDYQCNESGKLKIYFLMYRMKSLLRVLPSDDPRAKDSIVLLETDEESDYKLTIVQKELNVSLLGNEIDGFRNYLEYWESNPDKPLILHTENAIHFEKNHFFDDVRVIVTPYDLIKYQYGLPINISEGLGSEDNWNDLVKVIVKEGSFEDSCCSELSINKYSVSLFEKWHKLTGFQRWLLWVWTRLQTVKSYEVIVAKACNSVSDFVDEIYCRIVNYLHESIFEQYYAERKQLLALMQTVPTEKFWAKINSLDQTDALSCLTCLTDIEQKAVFRLISNIDYQNRIAVLPILKYTYPQLYYYLQNDSQVNITRLPSSYEQYFNEYKWQKATNTVSGEFVSKVKDIAKEKGSSVFKMKPRNHYVSEYYNDENTEILFVDGMGIEYVDYLAHLFADLDERQYSVTFEAGYCTLPSITELNKDFMKGRKVIDPPIRELDELKHANTSHPESLIRQLQILDALKSRALGLLVGHTRRIIIATDHGTSRLAVKVRNTEFDNVYPRPNNIEIYKYGRFCEGTQDEPNYPTAINYNDRLIFADYSRFIQNGAPIDEIHGGASLEEWIVPIIVVERLTEDKPEAAEVIPQQTKIKPELGTNKVRIAFTISGKKRNNVSARLKGVSYKCDWNDGVYNFTFEPSSDDNKLTVKVIDGGIIGEFAVEIEHGIKKNSSFDI